MARNSSKTRQNKFLKAFVELKIIQRACDSIGLKRSLFQSWMKTDPEFQAKMECLETAIDDQALEIFYKKAGILPMTDADKARGLHKWADNNLIAAIVKRMPRFKESTVINQTIMNLPIVGLTGSDLANLAAPDRGGIGETKDELSVAPRGLEFKDTEKEVKRLLLQEEEKKPEAPEVPPTTEK